MTGNYRHAEMDMPNSDYGMRFWDKQGMDAEVEALAETGDLQTKVHGGAGGDGEGDEDNAQNDDAAIRSHLKELDEIGGSGMGQETSTNMLSLKAKRENMSLAQLKRNLKRQENQGVDVEDDNEFGQTKRVKITNVTSEDAVLKEKRLITYYCYFCGEYCLISDGGKLNRLPQRRTDLCYIIDENLYTLKMNVNGARKKTIIKRASLSDATKDAFKAFIKPGSGANNSSSSSNSTDSSTSSGSAADAHLPIYEQQYRLQCKGCANLIGYRADPLGTPSSATYIFPDTLIEYQSRALKYTVTY